MKKPPPAIRVGRARELGKLPALTPFLDDDEPPRTRPSFVNDLSEPPEGASCDVTRCPREAVVMVTFGQTNGTANYCRNHAWPHTRGALE